MRKKKTEEALLLLHEIPTDAIPNKYARQMNRAKNLLGAVVANQGRWKRAAKK